MNINEFKKSHGYEIGGIWYPRVTKIVEIKAKPALYRFYARMENFEAGERIKQKSAEEGTLIHETVEAFLMGKTPDVHPSVKASIEAFVSFMKESGMSVDPEFIEFRLVNHDERYAGTLDAIAEIGGKKGILDIKTSQEIFRDYNLQTSAYMAAIHREIKDLETRWILRIDQIQRCLICGAKLRKKGGRPKVITQNGNARMRACRHGWGSMEGVVELKEFPLWHDDYIAFLGAKKLWEWEYKNELMDIGYLM